MEIGDGRVDLALSDYFPGMRSWDTLQQGVFRRRAERGAPLLTNTNNCEATTTVTKQTIARKLALSVISASLIIGLAACGGKEEKKAATQVAAKVNSEEISVHQINFVLSRTPGAGNVTPEQAPKLRREILDKLIDQQLAVEQALAKKLDRSPDVVMAIDAARREILARAYIEQLTAGQTKPTADEAKAYFTEHPQLFAERRIYNIQEIVVPVARDVAPALREMVAQGKPMDEIAGWLKGKGVQFTGASATRAAEQIPLELLPKVHALKDGQGMVMENGASATVMRVVASQSAPIGEAAALPRINQFLGNQRAAKAAEGELKDLKAKAKITYQGEFAEGAAAAAAPAVAPAPAAAAADKGGADKTAIEKGVAGLK